MPYCAATELRAMRKEVGLTQPVLCDLSGLSGNSMSYISLLEKPSSYANAQSGRGKKGLTGVAHKGLRAIAATLVSRGIPFKRANRWLLAHGALPDGGREELMYDVGLSNWDLGGRYNGTAYWGEGTTCSTPFLRSEIEKALHLPLESQRTLAAKLRRAMAGPRVAIP